MDPYKHLRSHLIGLQGEATKLETPQKIKYKYKMVVMKSSLNGQENPGVTNFEKGYARGLVKYELFRGLRTSFELFRF